MREPRAHDDHVRGSAWPLVAARACKCACWTPDVTALRVTLVRHGQARFDEDNYDLLSERGRNQALALGSWWRQQCFTPDFAWSGGMVRHTETAEHALHALPNRPAVQLETRMREFDHREIFYRHRPDLLDPSALMRWKAQAADYAQTFAETYDAALQRWMSAAHDNDYTESWLQFKTRCVTGLLEICHAALHGSHHAAAAAHGRPAELLVFTSSGPVSAIVQSCWAVPDPQLRGLQQGLMNTGLTSVRVDASAATWTMETVNACPHLQAQPQLMSWR